MTSEGIDLTRRDGVVTITLNRPAAKNSITPAGWNALSDALRNIRPPDDRVLVLIGEGGDFSAGNDLLKQAQSGLAPREFMRMVSEVALSLMNLPIPTIAAVDGVAVGAGMNLALACDFVLCTPEARFSQIFVKRGLSPDLGGTWLLPRLVGLRAAKEIAMLGEFVDARRAADLGLVNRVVPQEELTDAVSEVVEALRNRAPIALSATKAMLNRSYDVTLAQAVDNEADAQTINATTSDATEAFAAFREKRDPVFKGR